MLELVRWLSVHLPGSVALRGSAYGFSAILTAHVLALAVFAGLVVMMDLRLVRLGHRHAGAGEMHERLFPWFIGAFVLTVLSGLTMVWVDPVRYYGKTFFWAKLALMALAGVNAALVRRASRRDSGFWEGAGARAAGVRSLVLWAGVVALGRLTAYEWMTTEY